MAQIANSCIGTKPALSPEDPEKVSPKKQTIAQRLLWMLLAILFPGVFLVAMVRPVAAELNLSFVGELFGTLLTALTDIMPDFEDFIDVGFPLLIKIIIYVAIIGMIGLFLYFFSQVVEKIIKMIGLSGGK